MILIDGVRYNLHKFSKEEEFVATVKEHMRDILGNRSIYFDKIKIESLGGICSIPDGYAITIDEPRWYVIEFELSSHNVFNHIVPQVNKFINGINSDDTRRSLIDYMDKIMREEKLEYLINEGREVYRFLSKLIYREPTILLIIDEKIKELDDVLNSIKYETRIVEFKTFVREGIGLGVHAHLFEPLHSSTISNNNASQYSNKLTSSDYKFYILEALIEMNGKAKAKDVLDNVYKKIKDRLKAKDLEKTKSGAIRWSKIIHFERLNLKQKHYLKDNSDRGIWEITDTGRRLYEELKTDRALNR
ncbi:MAG: winged helix-turn-helix domain-containing protein [Candidatus Nitrosocaldaceae archaeon]